MRHSFSRDRRTFSFAKEDSLEAITTEQTTSLDHTQQLDAKLEVEDCEFEEPPPSSVMKFDALLLLVARSGDVAVDMVQKFGTTLMKKGLRIHIFGGDDASSMPDGGFEAALEASSHVILCLTSESSALLEDAFSPISCCVNAALRVIGLSAVLLVSVDEKLGYPSTWQGRLGQQVPANSMLYKCRDVPSDENSVESCSETIYGVLAGIAPSLGMTASLPAAGAVVHDVFLSHAWGTGKVVHDRVETINEALKERKVVTWFDGDKMKGDMNEAMWTAIESSTIVIVFVTADYQRKLKSGDDFDNCRREYQASLRTKGLENMLFVVMEEDMMDSAGWEGGLEAVNEAGAHPCITSPAEGNDLGCIPEICDFLQRHKARIEKGGEQPTSDKAMSFRCRGSVTKCAMQMGEEGATTLERELDEIMASNNTSWLPTIACLTEGYGHNNVGRWVVHEDMRMRTSELLQNKICKTEAHASSSGPPVTIKSSTEIEKALNLDSKNEMLVKYQSLRGAATHRHEQAAMWRLFDVFFLYFLVYVSFLLSPDDFSSMVVAVDPPDSNACVYLDRLDTAVGTECPVVVAQDVARWRYVRDLLARNTANGSLPMDDVEMAATVFYPSGFATFIFFCVLACVFFILCVFHWLSFNFWFPYVVKLWYSLGFSLREDGGLNVRASEGDADSIERERLDRTRMKQSTFASIVLVIPMILLHTMVVYVAMVMLQS